MNNKEKETAFTDEDRLKLAAKLDLELDEFINNLPKRKYEDGWPEDRWEEEMEKHPFFMKQSPQPGQHLHPLYEGLQKLKYDPNENEPHELAVAYKDDGNFNFKHKNYRLAIVAYTEGIKQKCGDADIEASLYNNRAASHWFLKNYRSCLHDCELALKLKPDYDKVSNRAAHCSYHLGQYDKAVEFCDLILEKNKTDKDILELRKKCVNDAKLKDRNTRKKYLEDKKKKQIENTLIEEILKRGYNIERKGNLNLSHLEPCFPELVNSRVYLDDQENVLIWPVVLVYPEYKIMDYIQQFPENVCFYEQLEVVFNMYPEWDVKQEYKVDNLNVYFETEKQDLVRVDVSKSLKEILQDKKYVIRAGTPSFLVVVRGSTVEKHLLNK